MRHIHRGQRSPKLPPPIRGNPQHYKAHLYAPYAAPAKQDMAVILVYYNPANSVRILQNVLFVKQKLEAATIPTYLVELAYDDKPHMFKESDTVFLYRSSSYLFYKENLINLAERRIPPQYTKICALDADVVYASPNWYDIISTTLDTHTICQGFEITQLLNISYDTVIQQMHSIFVNTQTGHPGYAWAVHRDFFKWANFPEMYLYGGGDNALVALAMNKTPTRFSSHAINRPTDLKSTYAKGLILYHMYHGSLKNRQYGSRNVMVEGYLRSQGRTTIQNIVYKREDGLLELLPQYKSGLNSLMIGFFNNRDDDSI